MPELDEHGNEANPDPNNPQPPTGEESPPGDEPPQGEISFSKKQLEQLGTLIGRISKQQFDERYAPLLETKNAPPAQVPPQTTPDVLKTFNEQLQQKIFEGDVLGAIQMATDVQTRARDSLSKSQLVETERMIVSYSEKPLYKDIHSEMDKIAKQAVGQGYPPGAAVEYAYTKALSDYLLAQKGGNTEDGSHGDGLSVLRGGRQQHNTKEPKLPPEFKAAFERDKAKGLFKDEKEYIASLSPTIRKHYGI